MSMNICCFSCKALRCHLQSFALPLAKLCVASCKALHCHLQSIAITIVLNSSNSRYLRPIHFIEAVSKKSILSQPLSLSCHSCGRRIGRDMWYLTARNRMAHTVTNATITERMASMPASSNPQYVTPPATLAMA